MKQIIEIVDVLGREILDSGATPPWRWRSTWRTALWAAPRSLPAPPPASMSLRAAGRRQGPLPGQGRGDRGEQREYRDR